MQADQLRKHGDCEQYTDAKRLEELWQARGRGLVAARIIAYHHDR